MGKRVKTPLCMWRHQTHQRCRTLHNKMNQFIMRSFHYIIINLYRTISEFSNTGTD